jgi:hypothetical protein
VSAPRLPSERASDAGPRTVRGLAFGEEVFRVQIASLYIGLRPRPSELEFEIQHR